MTSRAAAFVVALLALSVLPPGPRALAQPPQPTAESASLQRAVEQLRSFVTRRGGKLGAAVVDLASGELLAGEEPRRLANPASNMKVLTAAIALKELGPQYRFTTGVYGRIERGTARRLVLRGHGDPSLGTEDLWRLARSLKQQGLRRVEALLVDQSRFDAQFVPPAFEQQPNEWASFRAPVSAIAVDRNAVTLNVLAAEPNQNATVWFDPPGVVDIQGRVLSRRRGSGQGVRLTLTPEGSKLRGQIGGHVAEGLPRLRFKRRVDDPTLLPGWVLRHLLAQQGIEVPDSVRAGGEKETRRLTYVGSDRLATLLGELGKKSDNFYAEMVLKAVGLDAKGAPGTSAAGAEVVLAWLREIGAAEAGTTIRNGSGLFDANRVSALTLARALRAGARDPSLSTELVAQLAIGGVDGTLRSRFRKHRNQRRIRAKTGTLAKVDALSGYVLSPDGQPAVAFSFIVEGLGDHPANRRAIDAAVGEILRALDAP